MNDTENSVSKNVFLQKSNQYYLSYLKILDPSLEKDLAVYLDFLLKQRPALASAILGIYFKNYFMLPHSMSSEFSKSRAREVEHLVRLLIKSYIQKSASSKPVENGSSPTVSPLPADNLEELCLLMILFPSIFVTPKSEEPSKTNFQLTLDKVPEDDLALALDKILDTILESTEQLDLEAKLLVIDSLLVQNNSIFFGVGSKSSYQSVSETGELQFQNFLKYYGRILDQLFEKTEGENQENSSLSYLEVVFLLGLNECLYFENGHKSIYNRKERSLRIEEDIYTPAGLGYSMNLSSNKKDLGPIKPNTLKLLKEKVLGKVTFAEYCISKLTKKPPQNIVQASMLFFTLMNNTVTRTPEILAFMEKLSAHIRLHMHSLTMTQMVQILGKLNIMVERNTVFPAKDLVEFLKAKIWAPDRRYVMMDRHYLTDRMVLLDSIFSKPSRTLDLESEGNKNTPEDQEDAENKSVPEEGLSSDFSPQPSFHQVSKEALKLYSALFNVSFPNKTLLPANAIIDSLYFLVEDYDPAYKPIIPNIIKVGVAFQKELHSRYIVNLFKAIVGWNIRQGWLGKGFLFIQTIKEEPNKRKDQKLRFGSQTPKKRFTKSTDNVDMMGFDLDHFADLLTLSTNPLNYEYLTTIKPFVDFLQEDYPEFWEKVNPHFDSQPKAPQPPVSWKENSQTMTKLAKELNFDYQDIFILDKHYRIEGILNKDIVVFFTREFKFTTRALNTLKSSKLPYSLLLDRKYCATDYLQEICGSFRLSQSIQMVALLKKNYKIQIINTFRLKKNPDDAKEWIKQPFIKSKSVLKPKD